MSNMATRPLITALSTSILAITSATGALWLAHTNAIEATRLADVLQTLHDEQNTIHDQGVLRELLDTTVTERAELSSYVINGEDETIRFLSRIDNLAAVYGVTLSTDSLTIVPKIRKPYAGLRVVYSFKGSDEAVRVFIGALETIPYSSTVTALSVTKTIDEQTGVTLISGSATLLVSTTQS